MRLLNKYIYNIYVHIRIEYIVLRMDLTYNIANLTRFVLLLLSNLDIPLLDILGVTFLGLRLHQTRHLGSPIAAIA